MKKICVICIASVLMLTGCSDNSDRESGSSSDPFTVVVTRDSAEEFEISSEDDQTDESQMKSYEKEYSDENTTIAADFKSESELVTKSEVENKSHVNSSSDHVAQEELPIMNDEIQEPEENVTTAAWENSKINATTLSETTTVTKNNNVVTSTTDVTKDNVIELPFVPAK